jgi:hypothetical protein
VDAREAARVGHGSGETADRKSRGGRRDDDCRSNDRRDAPEQAVGVGQVAVRRLDNDIGDADLLPVRAGRIVAEADEADRRCLDGPCQRSRPRARADDVDRP